MPVEFIASQQTSATSSPYSPTAIRSPADEITRLRKLYELSMTLAGDPIDIFKHVAKMIGELMDVKVVCLSEIRGSELYFLSVYVDGELYTDAGQCDLAITPCSTVENSKDFRVYDQVMEKFPQASFLKTHNAYSYCGFPALDNHGKVVAVICLLDDRPHEFSDEDHEILRIFGQRVGIEIERQHHLIAREKAEHELREHRDNLEELVAQRTAQLQTALQELISKERLATLGQLTATVSHELRNPLGTIQTSIYSIAEKLRDKGLGVERALARVQRNITRCDNIITELLDFTRIKKLDYSVVNFDKWLEEVVNEMKLPAGIGLDTLYQSGRDISMDTGLMRRVVINIYNNACEAMQPDKNSAKNVEQKHLLSITSRLKDDQWVEIAVNDTGGGMEQAVLEKMFEPLFSTKGFGVGLGLPMVKQIVEQHKGTINIFNVDQGAQVIIKLPLRNNH